jgi:hypothetical protein
MIRALSQCVLLACVTVCLAVPVFPSGFSIEPVTAHGRSGPGSSLLLDSTGQPEIFYVDPLRKVLLMARRSGSGWTEDSIATTAGTGYELPARRAPDGRAVVVYPSSAGGDWYATGSAGAWTESLFVSQLLVGAYPSLALDRCGIPVMTCYSGDCGALNLYRRTATGIVQELPFGACTGGALSGVGVDSLGRILVIGSGENCGLRYAERDLAGTWTRTLLTYCDFYQGVALAVGNDGEPRIVFCEYNGHRIRFGRRTSGLWRFTTFDTGGSYAHPSLVLRGDDEAHVAYFDNGQLRYARGVGGAWSAGVADAVGWVGRYPSLAIDANGIAHISYYSTTDSLVRYARGTPVLSVDPPPATVDRLRVTPNPARGPIVVSAPADAGERLVILDASGRRVREGPRRRGTAGGDWEWRIDLSGLRPGVYLLQIRGRQSNVTGRVLWLGSEKR